MTKSDVGMALLNDPKLESGYTFDSVVATLQIHSITYHMADFHRMISASILNKSASRCAALRKYMTERYTTKSSNGIPPSLEFLYRCGPMVHDGSGIYHRVSGFCRARMAPSVRRPTRV